MLGCLHYSLHFPEMVITEGLLEVCDSMDEIKNQRVAEAAIDDLFMKRWSPRAFADRPVSPEILKSLFEAARWSPSCFNEQPWLFLYAVTEKDRQKFLSLLSEKNQSWARTAPVLAFIFAKRHFDLNGKPNDWAAFDCGAAWMSLTLQARLHGLYTHGMAGYNRGSIYRELGVDREKYEAIAAIALGYIGDPSVLNESQRRSERPNNRKPLSRVAHEGPLQ